jgi:hypothetical protein
MRNTTPPPQENTNKTDTSQMDEILAPSTALDLSRKPYEMSIKDRILTRLSCGLVRFRRLFRYIIVKNPKGQASDSSTSRGARTLSDRFYRHRANYEPLRGSPLNPIPEIEIEIENENDWQYPAEV